MSLNEIQCFEVVLVTLQLNDLHIYCNLIVQGHVLSPWLHPEVYMKGSKLTYLYSYVRLELGMAQMVVGFLSSPGVMC